MHLGGGPIVWICGGGQRSAPPGRGDRDHLGAGNCRSSLDYLATGLAVVSAQSRSSSKTLTRLVPPPTGWTPQPSRERGKPRSGWSSP